MACIKQYPPKNIHGTRNEAVEGKNELSLLKLRGRLDELISTLERQLSCPEPIKYHHLCGKDKWDSFNQIEKDESPHFEEKGPGDGNFSGLLLSDYRQYLSPNLIASALKSMQAQLGICELADTPANLPMLLAQIPRLNQAFQCLDYYHESCGWIHRLLHWPSFCVKVFKLLSRKDRLSYCNPPDIHLLGVLFAVCALGLWTSISDCGETSGQICLPTNKQGRRKLALTWFRCATSALVLGRYEEETSLSSLQTMSLLLCFPLYFSDEPLMEGAIELTHKTIQLARKLKLDIDPDELPCCSSSSDVVKDERRRFMMAILCQEFHLGGLFCKKGSFELPSEFTLKMPHKIFDQESQLNPNPALMTASEDPFGQACRLRSTDLNGVISRYRVGQIWQLVGIRFHESGGPPSHAQVLELDQQLLAAEREFPSGLRTNFEPRNCIFDPPLLGQPLRDMDRLSTYINLASAHIRLHRPFVIPRDGISTAHHEWHRGRILYYGRLILTVNETNDLPLLKHVSMNFFVLAASIALAVLLITATGKEENMTSLRRQVYRVHRAYQESPYKRSLIRDRGYELLGILLQADKARLLCPTYKINFQLLQEILH